MGAQRGHPRFEQWAIFRSKDPDDILTETEFLAVYAGEHDSKEDWAQNEREETGESQSGPQFNQFVNSSFHPVNGTHWILASDRNGGVEQPYDSHFVYLRTT